MVPEPTELPGGGSALLRGCSCEFTENRGGRGVAGLVVGIDSDGVAHRIEQSVYVVRVGCPVHAPRRPWWTVPGLLLSAAGTSVAVTTTADHFWSPLVAIPSGFVSGVVAMLLCARWYDHCLKRRRR